MRIKKKLGAGKHVAFRFQTLSQQVNIIFAGHFLYLSKKKVLNKNIKAFIPYYYFFQKRMAAQDASATMIQAQFRARLTKKDVKGKLALIVKVLSIANNWRDSLKSLRKAAMAPISSSFCRKKAEHENYRNRYPRCAAF